MRTPLLILEVQLVFVIYISGPVPYFTPVARAKRVFCQLAVKEIGYSGAEVARFPGVTTSAVNRSANSEEIPEVSRDS